MRFDSPRHRRIQPSRYWLLLLLPMLLLLTTPMPLPRSVAYATRSTPVAASTAIPTARIDRHSPTSAVPVASAIPAVVAALPAATELPTTLPVLSTVSLLPSATMAVISATPEPPSATLPPPLIIVTAPPAPPTLLPTLGAAPPTLLPPQPAAPIAPPVAGPAAPAEQPLYIPTLMYHYVRIVDAAADPLGYNLSVTPHHLNEQLDWLVQRGYTTVTMNTLMRCRNGGSAAQPCPVRPVALTFDDGYEDAFTEALPALQRRGMVATFYIISGFAGQPRYMTWNQIRKLQAAGMEIGSHTINHPDLTTLSWEQAHAEIFDSKAVIESNIGRPVTSFCYPSGRFNDDVVALVQQAGYTNATTTMPDLSQSNLLLLPRLRVEGSYELGQFEGLVP